MWLQIAYVVILINGIMDSYKKICDSINRERQKNEIIICVKYLNILSYYNIEMNQAIDHNLLPSYLEDKKGYMREYLKQYRAQKAEYRNKEKERHKQFYEKK